MEFLVVDEHSTEMPAEDNSRIVKLLNETLPFRVYNPRNKSQINVEELTAGKNKKPNLNTFFLDEVPKKRRRMNKTFKNQPAAGTLGDLISTTMKFENGDLVNLIPSTSQLQPNNVTFFLNLLIATLDRIIKTVASFFEQQSHQSRILRIIQTA